MRQLVFFVLPFLFSCGASQSDVAIVVPQIDQEFYEKSIVSLEEQIEAFPEEPKYIKLQLSYYRELGWPKDARQAIERARGLLGDDPLFFNQMLEYYFENNQHLLIIDIIEERERIGTISRSLLQRKIASLVELGQSIRAEQSLVEFVKDTLSDEETLLCARAYRQMNDTAKALDYYERISNSDDYRLTVGMESAGMLNALGKHEACIQLLEMIDAGLLSATLRQELADAYYSIGERNKAVSLLINQVDESSLLLLSDFYALEEDWDSVQYAYNQILQHAPDNRNILIAAGNMNQNRGYFTYSLGFYNKLLELDSTDQYAIDQVDLVNRKIAYLQKIRESAKEIPVLELNTKKISDQ
ncbi:MAG: hypothetical protein JXQ90_23535 [Cyclobacteriaceae bacterium]